MTEHFRRDTDRRPATGMQRAVPAETGTALKDPRAEKSNAHRQSTTLGTIGVSVINWTETAATPAQNSTHTPPVSEKKLTKRERERAAYLATARVKRIGPGHYEAESGSRMGAWYTCRLVRGYLSCSCPATDTCKHILRCTPLLLADARLLEAENREANAPTLLSAERLAVLRQQAEYGDSWLSGGVL